MTLGSKVAGRKKVQRQRRASYPVQHTLLLLLLLLLLGTREGLGGGRRQLLQAVQDYKKHFRAHVFLQSVSIFEGTSRPTTHLHKKLLVPALISYCHAMRRSLSLTSMRGTLITNFPLRAFSTAPSGVPSQAPAATPSAPVVEVEEVWKGTLQDEHRMDAKGYKNFLQETLYALHCEGKKPSDVLHVKNGNSLGTWADFVLMSDYEYDSGYGVSTISVNPQLVILGNDWWLKRREYDGSTWWEFLTYPVPPTQGIEKLTMKGVWE